MPVSSAEHLILSLQRRSVRSIKSENECTVTTVKTSKKGNQIKTASAIKKWHFERSRCEIGTGSLDHQLYSKTDAHPEAVNSSRADRSSINKKIGWNVHHTRTASKNGCTLEWLQSTNTQTNTNSTNTQINLKPTLLWNYAPGIR